MNFLIAFYLQATEAAFSTLVVYGLDDCAFGTLV